MSAAPTARPEELEAMRALLSRVAQAIGKTHPVFPVGATLLGPTGALGSAVASRSRPDPVKALMRFGGPDRTLLLSLAHARDAAARRELLADLRRLGVARVVVAAETLEGPAVCRAMQRAGMAVVRGVSGARAEELHRAERWLVAEGRPWVTLKIAASLDGRISVASGDSRWITGPLARKEGHRLRARHAAILVGAGTVEADDPALTVREVRGEDPVAVVLDSALRTARSGAGIQLLRPGTLFIHTSAASERARRRVEAAGAEAVPLPPGPDGHPELREVLDLLAGRGLPSVLVEGGGRVHGRFLAAGLCEELHLFQGPRVLGEGTPAVSGMRHERVADAPAFDPVRRRALGADLHVVLRPRR